MSQSYLPLTDEGVREWTANFASKIVGNPAGLGLTPEQVSAYQSIQTDYAIALVTARDPATRGGARILEKNNLKTLLVAESRKLAMAVTNHPGVNNAQRYDMGLTLKGEDPTPVPPPSVSPVLEVLSVSGWSVKLRAHRESSMRGKPAGVQGMTVFSYVGEVPPTKIEDWKFEGNTTQTSKVVTFPTTLPPGTQLWFTAFWFNSKAQSGPACMPVSTQVNYGAVPQAA